MIGSAYKRTLSLVGAVALVVLGAVVWNWYRPPTISTLYRAVPTPYLAERSPALRGVETEQKCVPTIVYRPTEKQESKLGVNVPDDSDLLTSAEIKPLPYGGKAVVTIPRPTVEIPFPEAVVTIVPKKQPFWELTPARSLSGWVGVGGSQGFTTGRVIGVELRQGLLRSGPVEWDLRAGALMLGDRSDWYAAVGATVRF